MPTYGSEFRTLLPRDFPLIDSLNISLTDEKKREKNPREQLCLLFYRQSFTPLVHWRSKSSPKGLGWLKIQLWAEMGCAPGSAGEGKRDPRAMYHSLNLWAHFSDNYCPAGTAQSPAGGFMKGAGSLIKGEEIKYFQEVGRREGQPSSAKASASGGEI